LRSTRTIFMLAYVAIWLYYYSNDFSSWIATFRIYNGVFSKFSQFNVIIWRIIIRVLWLSMMFVTSTRVIYYFITCMCSMKRNFEIDTV